MIILENRYKGFKIKSVTFADEPTDMNGCDRLVFSICKKDDSDIVRKDFKTRPIYHTSIDLKKPTEEIYKSFNGTTRANLNRAEREGITYKINEDWAQYIELQNKFIKLKKLWLKPYTKEFLQQYKGFLITAYHAGKMLEGGYFVIEDDILWTQSIFSFRVIDRSYERLCSQASRYLYFQAMKHGKSLGCNSLYFAIGNDIENPTSIGKFKLGFGGTVFKKNIYVKDYNPILKVASKFGVGTF